MTSYHPSDIEERYCGYCHHFCNDIAEGPPWRSSDDVDVDPSDARE